MSSSFDPVEFVEQLKELLARLPIDVEAFELSKASLTRLRRDIQSAVEVLLRLGRHLDPIRQPPSVLDPSDPRVIGQLIARTLLEQPMRPLGLRESFYGSGVYAIYYAGPFSPYKRISGRNHPMYVGKADPESPDAKTVEEQGPRLARRLMEHAKSIRYAENLSVEHFTCRYLVVKSAWQRTAEEYLIDRFRPVWNSEMGVCYGFGKHGDKSTTRRNTRSPWDTLHPGRPWASDSSNVPNPKSPEQISREIVSHLKKIRADE